MRNKFRISVIIPAVDEELSIGKVIAEIPGWVDEIIVVDNGSEDKTADVAQSAGAKVLFEPRRGYGCACLTGIAKLDNPDIVVFLDGDYSDYPGEMSSLVDPVINGSADLVIGSRVLGQAQEGALSPQARFGNWLACKLIRLFWKIRFTDLGPFRAIRFSTLNELDMRDRNYGWTVEMQIKAAQRGQRALEVPVSYRKRIGKSKVSGTVRGVVLAGTKILTLIFVSAIGLEWNRKRKMPLKAEKRKVNNVR
jgi:glycosyltransferase involved in cell wall biosynthesis